MSRATTSPDSSQTPPLQVDASYTVTIATGVASAQGVKLAKPYTYSFTTRASTDTSPIYVASVSPAPNATCVSATSPITITFSEGADVTTVNSTNIVITGPGNQTIKAQMSYDVATAVVTLTPAAALPSGNITVTVRNVADAAGAAMQEVYGWSFETTCATGGGANGSEFLYIFGAGTTPQIYAYRIDPATGVLTAVPGMPFQPGIGASAGTCNNLCSFIPLADPAGRFLFYDFSWIPTQGFGTMRVDAATGALTNDDVLVVPQSGSGDPPTSHVPYYLSTDPQGRFIFGPVQANDGATQAQNWIRSVVVAPDGHLSFASGEPFQFPGTLAYGAPAVSDQFVYVSNYNTQYPQPSSLYGFALNQASGALSQSSTTDDGIEPGGQVITPSGKFLYAQQLNNVTDGAQVVGFKVNADGSLTQLSQAPQQAPNQNPSLMMSPNGNFLYVVGGTPLIGSSSSAGEVRAYAIDQNSGALSLTAVYDYPNSEFPLAIDQNVQYVYFRETDTSNPSAPTYSLKAYTVNSSNGSLTPSAEPATPVPADPVGTAIVRPQ